jgi:hypothetical protein
MRGEIVEDHDVAGLSALPDIGEKARLIDAPPIDHPSAVYQHIPSLKAFH